MKQAAASRLFRPMLWLLVAATLSGCSGYASNPSSSSGVEVYGTVDAGVSHQGH